MIPTCSGKKGKAFPCLFFMPDPRTLGAWALFLLAQAAGIDSASAQSPDRPAALAFPVIKTLDARDTSFVQYVADVEEARRRISLLERIGDPEKAKTEGERIAGTLAVYAYAPKAGDDAFTLAARCSLPYASIASLNRLTHPAALASLKLVLLPTIPGLYIPESADSDLEKLIALGRSGEPGVEIVVRKDAGPMKFRFLPGEDYNPTERAFFLNLSFRFPLPFFRISSDYGLRRNPVTGSLKAHEGIDLAAPEGTEVYAARDGRVSRVGTDPIYGNFVVVEHDGGWTSLYGHLSSIRTVLRKEVRSGTLIGTVGSTGQSTGPHLHFELRQDGRPKDPSMLLPSRGPER